MPLSRASLPRALDLIRVRATLDTSPGPSRTPLLRALDLGLGGCCALLLLGLVALTVIDVVGRYVFTAPLAGAFELTELMLGALVFAALPLATMTGEHVAVDALFDRSPPRLRTALAWLGGGATAAALWVIAWRLVVYSTRLANDEAVTDALLVPLAPLGWFAAAMAALSGLLAVVRSLGGGTARTPAGSAGRQAEAAARPSGRVKATMGGPGS